MLLMIDNYDSFTWNLAQAHSSDNAARTGEVCRYLSTIRIRKKV
jgi:anthranilate/para-aminobenzoate synthase component II